MPTFLDLARIALAVFLVLFPLQIRMLFFSPNVYDGGALNLYSSFFIYAADVFLFFALIFWGFALVRGEAFLEKLRVESLLLAGLVLWILFSALWAEVPFLAFLNGLRFASFFLLYLLLMNEVLVVREVIFLLMGGLMFQSFLAILQYILQRSVGLGFVGEPFLRVDEPGVAKLQVGELTLLRSYGTFPHPNVLGGAVAITFLWFYGVLRKRRNFFMLVASALLFTLFLSFSRSALAAFVVSFAVFAFLDKDRFLLQELKGRKMVAGLLLGVLGLAALGALGPLWERVASFNDPNSFNERGLYLGAGLQMLWHRPLGVGASHFTLSLQDFSLEKLTPWLLQPVHNTFLLVANEVGFVGLIFFTAILYFFGRNILRILKNRQGEARLLPLLLLSSGAGMLILFLFDHYFWTLYPGQVLLFLYFGLAASLLKKLPLPKRKS